MSKLSHSVTKKGERRKGKVKIVMRRLVIILIAAVIAVTLLSCLSLSPPKGQVEKRKVIKRELSSIQRKRVIWRSVNVSKPLSVAEAEIVEPSQTKSTSDELLQGMVLIPAGEFLIGSAENEGDKDEHPQHLVYLDAYYIDKYEVTNTQYYQFWIADGGEKSKHTPASYGSSYLIGDWPEVAKTKPNCPVIGITWYDAQAYAEWASKRLPTEAEWEKAARGTEGRTWPWGDDFYIEIDGKNAHSNRWDGNDGYDNTTAPVGSYPTGVSSYGVYDMTGNVWEWVADWYDKDYYSHSPKNNPKGPDKGKLHVVRGGSWRNREYIHRCANRYYCYPDIWGNTLGFRCVKDVP